MSLGSESILYLISEFIAEGSYWKNKVSSSEMLSNLKTGHPEHMDSNFLEQEKC